MVSAHRTGIMPDPMQRRYLSLRNGASSYNLWRPFFDVSDVSVAKKQATLRTRSIVLRSEKREAQVESTDLTTTPALVAMGQAWCSEFLDRDGEGCLHRPNFEICSAVLSTKTPIAYMSRRTMSWHSSLRREPPQ